MTDELFIPYRFYARVSGGAAVVLAAAGGLALAAELLVASLVLLPVAFTLLVLWITFFLLARSWERKVRALEGGDLLARWTYPDDRWRAWLAEQRRKGRWALPVFVAVISGSGLLVGILLRADGTDIAGSGALTVLLPTGIGTGLGLLSGLTGKLLGAWTLRRMLEIGGRCLIGAEGLYLTGQFWPWKSLGVGFRSVALELDPDPRLLFTFHVSSGRTSRDQEVPVPIPAGEGALREAEGVVAALTGR